jgi:hypothetical protein
MGNFKLPTNNPKKGTTKIGQSLQILLKTHRTDGFVRFWLVLSGRITRSFFLYGCCYVRHAPPTAGEIMTTPP